MNTLNKIFGFFGGKKLVATGFGLLALYYTRKTGVEVKPEDIQILTASTYAIAGVVMTYVAAQAHADANTNGKTSSVALLAEAEKK